MSERTQRLDADVDVELFATFLEDLNKFKLSSTMQQRTMVEKVGWDLNNRRRFIESAIRKCHEELQRAQWPWWKKDLGLK
jgi:hypothetical protein